MDPTKRVALPISDSNYDITRYLAEIVQYISLLALAKELFIPLCSAITFRSNKLYYHILRRSCHLNGKYHRQDEKFRKNWYFVDSFRDLERDRAKISLLSPLSRLLCRRYAIVKHSVFNASSFTLKRIWNLSGRRSISLLAANEKNSKCVRGCIFSLSCPFFPLLFPFLFVREIAFEYLKDDSQQRCKLLSLAVTLEWITLINVKITFFVTWIIESAGVWTG